jgi:transmembrane protein 8A/B
MFFNHFYFLQFYHACDEVAFNFCILRLNVLQFCDFYSAILAFWVTLIAMSELPPALTSLMHMAGAITVALGIEYDRYGLVTFMVPVVSGLVTLIISWVSAFPSHRFIFSCFYSVRYAPKKIEQNFA